jgi:hypothetical protein
MLREPERLAIASLIGVSLLAGLAFERSTAGLHRWLRVAAATVVLAVVYLQYAQGFSVPFRRRPLPARYPTALVGLSPELDLVLRRGEGPVLELPVGPAGGVSPFFHAMALYRSTLHWRPLLNGYNGYWPERFPERMALAGQLPDADALSALHRESGLTTVVVHRTPGYGEQAYAEWERLAAAGGRDNLRFVARAGDALVFTVDVPAAQE